MTSAVPRWSIRELIWAVVAALCTPASGAVPVADPGRSVGSRIGSDHTCDPTEELQFICGAEHPEDLAHIPGTPWLIASGFSDGAGLKLIDTRTDAMQFWYTGGSDQRAPDKTEFPLCPSAPEAALFNAQGINLRKMADGRYRLYVVNHGGRESVEVFTVELLRNGEPVLAWKGCVLMLPGMAANSVASFSDGTILASVLTRPGTTIADFVEGRKTGAIYEWKPGSRSFALIPGTELPGNNGLETSPDDREFYVVAFGWHAVLAFSRAHPDREFRKAIAAGFMPDNIHWDNGRLIAAGMKLDEPACGGVRKVIDGKADGMLCHRGYVVAELEPYTMSFKVVAYAEPNPDFNGVSAAVVVDNELWLGSYQANRVAHRRLPGLPRSP